MPTTSKKKPRHHKPGKTKPPLVPLTREQCRTIAANVVARTVGGHFKSLGKLPPSIMDEWRPSLAAEAAEWRAETGEEMPRGIDEIKAAATREGLSFGLPSSSSVVGDYTLADIHAMQCRRLEERRRQAEEIMAIVSRRDPSTLMSPYDRFIVGLGNVAKKYLATMLEYGLIPGEGREPQERIAHWADLPFGVVKACTKKAGDITAAEKAAGFKVIDRKRSGSGGSLLTADGVEVAKRIDKKILSWKYPLLDRAKRKRSKRPTF